MRHSRRRHRLSVFAIGIVNAAHIFAGARAEPAASPTPASGAGAYPVPGTPRTRATAAAPAASGSANPATSGSVSDRPASARPAAAVPREPLATLTPDELPGHNAAVLRAIESMPPRGGYSASHAATERLRAAIALPPSGGRGLHINAADARPSFCSSATYLVFLKTIEALRARGELALDDRAASALLVHGQRDGEGVWGRWNANGPGTAKLFHDLELGPNFTDFTRARRGDFMKIFWTPAIGKREHGHSVVFLGHERAADGVEWVRFWSSNQGVGYGEKRVPMLKIKYAIFSRLQNPRRLEAAGDLAPAVDQFLASLLTQESDRQTVQRECGL